MKKGTTFFFATLFMAMMTFTFWYAYQYSINQQIHILDQKLMNVHLNP